MSQHQGQGKGKRTKRKFSSVSTQTDCDCYVTERDVGVQCDLGKEEVETAKINVQRYYEAKLLDMRSLAKIGVFKLNMPHMCAIFYVLCMPRCCSSEAAI